MARKYLAMDMSNLEHLNRPPSHQHCDPVLELAGGEEKSVLGRALHGVAQRTNAARDDRNLLDRIDTGQARGNERMAHLVIGDTATLFRAQDPALLFDAGDDTLDRGGEILEGILAGLRQHLDGEARARILAEVDKDLTKHSFHEIERRLSSA